MTPPGRDKTWIDEQIETIDTTSELWQWETMLVFHLKISIKEGPGNERQNIFRELRTAAMVDRTRTKKERQLIWRFLFSYIVNYGKERIGGIRNQTKGQFI